MYSANNDHRSSNETNENKGTSSGDKNTARNEQNYYGENQILTHQIFNKQRNEKVRIVLLGKTGSGKSACGNTILNKECFESNVCSSSVTSRCTFGYAERFGMNLEVIDTPGTFDTSMPKDVLEKEIVKCMGMSAPGPHCFLLVINSETRYTPEEEDAVYTNFRLFGENIFRYTILVFTKKDSLDYHNKTLKEHVNNATNGLQKIIQDCNYRCIAFNNRATGPAADEQVIELLKMISAMQSGNKKEYYTDDRYLKAEETLKEQYKAIEDERKREMEMEKQKIKSEVEQKYTDINEQQKEEKKLIDQLTYRFSQLLPPRYQVMFELANDERVCEILLAGLGVAAMFAVKHFARNGFRIT